MTKRLAGVMVLLIVAIAVTAYAWPRGGGSPHPAADLRQQDAEPALLSPTPLPGMETHQASPAATAQKVPSDRYLVLFVLDGARPDYFDVPGTPHLQALIRSGTRYTNGWAGILESETPSGHASIGTGSTPQGDGILSFNWANNDNTTVNLFDPSEIQNGHMERIIQKAPAPTIAGIVHAYDRSARVVALGGHKYYAQDAIGGPYADAIIYYTGTPDGRFVPVAVPGHMPPASILNDKSLSARSSQLPMGVEDRLSLSLAVKTFQVMRPRVMLINVPEFDWPLGHVYGGDRDHKGVVSLMQGFDHSLGQIEDAYRKAGILGKTVFVVTADHGFAPIYYTVSQTAIDDAVAKAGTSIISDTYHTASYIWVKDSARAAAAAANIARLQNPYIQSVYFKSQLPGGGFEYIRATGPDLFLTPGMEAANQYLLRTFDGPNGPDVAVFFTEDAASLPGGESVWKGDHGGAAWNSQHLPLAISGPGVRRGVVSDFPAPLIDIAPTALSLMGMSSQGMQGIPLADAIAGSSARMQLAQGQQGREMFPVISALKAESRLEVAHKR